MSADKVHYVKSDTKRLRVNRRRVRRPTPLTTDVEAVKLTDARELLVCSGQTAMGPEGSVPVGADMDQQVRTVLENVVTVLTAGGMTGCQRREVDDLHDGR